MNMQAILRMKLWFLIVGYSVRYLLIQVHTYNFTEKRVIWAKLNRFIDNKLFLN